MQRWDGSLRRWGWFTSLAIAAILAAPTAAQVLTDPGTVIRTLDTSLWSPPSPDPSGIAYRPDTGELLTCDSEVEETVQGITLYQGVNVWTHSTTGIVNAAASATTVVYSNEPNGIAFDPAGGRLWISDDSGPGRIHQVRFGLDEVFGTADDLVNRIDDLVPAGCDDVEDVTLDVLHGDLFLASGAGQEICRIEPGPNGSFDGLPPRGDDVLSTYDVGASGITDPEGIVYDPLANTLVVADRGTRELYELRLSGEEMELLRKIDVNFPTGTRPSGVAIAPAPLNPMRRDYFVSDRRVDNNADPFENDGRIYQVVAIPLGGNGPPVVDAGPSQTIEWPANSTELTGFVSDDGHPYEPSTLTSLWTRLSGPGTVSFANPTQPATTASFSSPGVYVLQLLANDSVLASLDTVTITLSQTVTLSVVTSGPGSVSLTPPGGSYALGETVTVSAIPNAGAIFAGFSGDLSGATTPRPLPMDGNKVVTATFASSTAACGLGPELALILPLLGTLYRRRRAS